MTRTRDPFDEATDATGSTDSGLSTDGGASTAAAVQLCPSTAPRCRASQMPVLLGTDDGCRWACQPDPLYKAPSDSKGPIIGSSLGAMVLVLVVLLGLLLLAHAKKVRRERAAFNKDTEDLARELSYAPLLQPESSYRRPSVANASTASQEGLASRLAPFLGLRSGAEQSARARPTFVSAAPGFAEPGTELTMDVVGRPPESDPSLVLSCDAAPYRQGTVVGEYPRLAEFSAPSDASAAAAMPRAMRCRPSAPPPDNSAASLDDIMSPFATGPTTPGYKAGLPSFNPLHSIAGTPGAPQSTGAMR
ncbi:hypothetical protein H4R21_003079 [Coemansia helicoidea]|uniref:Uncharacterized protein n=1 Tax=Coemansia helicoidea TaxID=1286919 RepID=A0ACC1L4C7_9FUNG|nr:hypothetical protein H4R21_003079 [Coemansia helicoidea]